MNPFTQSILHRLSQWRLKKFVEHWDRLEALVIRIYKAGMASSQDEAEYLAVKRWLERDYPRWQDGLQPFWLAVKRGGEPLLGDPFNRLINAKSAADFVGDWEAMQTLPAAREALNHYLIGRLEELGR